MAVKSTFALCTLALLFQSSSSQCLHPRECNRCPASTGGGFVVTSSSPIAPIGISIISNNLYEGILTVEGDLPLLGSVGLEGVMGTAGAGAVSYGCGDGDTAIVEDLLVTDIAGPGYFGYNTYDYGNGLYGLGYGNGFYGLGYGTGLGFGYGNGVYGLGFGNGVYRLGYGNGYGTNYGYCGAIYF